MVLEPLFDNVLVKVDEVEEVSEGGIYIPEAARDQEQDMQSRGTVVAVGPGRPAEEDGLKRAYVPMVLEIGDKIYFGKYAGTDVTFEGVDYYLMSEQTVLGVVRDA